MLSTRKHCSLEGDAEFLMHSYNENGAAFSPSLLTS